MKLHIFGTCAGTEPMPNRRHTSFALEAGGGLYWFDAGEGCSYTAHLMGLDLLNVRAVFISHTHMDHIGGLGNLFWNIRKLTWVNSRQPERDIELFIPNMASWDAILTMLKNTEDNFRCKFKINAHSVSDGIIFDDIIKVEALHNLHLGETEPWRSFSYRINAVESSGSLTARPKTIVYSGDIKAPSDLDGFLMDGCDMLLVETGHHRPDAIARYINGCGYKVGHIAYIHSGRDILVEPEKSAELIRSVWGGGFTICSDGQTIEL